MDIIFILLLGIATYVDIKKREIPDTVCICIGLISLFNFHLLGIFATLPFLIFEILKSDSIGGGDIKLTAAVGLYLGFWNTIYGIIIALTITTIIQIVNIIYAKIIRQKVLRIAVPLAPFLTLGFLTIYLIF